MLSNKESRDPEDRLIDEGDPLARKDKMLDKTIADSFPASDPPSSLPDADEDSFAALPSDDSRLPRSRPQDSMIVSVIHLGVTLQM